MAILIAAPHALAILPTKYPDIVYNLCPKFNFAGIQCSKTLAPTYLFPIVNMLLSQ